MYKIKNLVFAAIFMIPLIHYGQHTDEINSNRPGETMSAFAVGKSVIQVESGIYGIKENHSILNYDANGFGIDMTLRWGLFMEKLELIADLQYQYEFLNPAFIYPERSAFKQTILGAKYLIYDPFKNYEKKVNVYSWKANHDFNWHQLIPAVSVFAGSAGSAGAAVEAVFFAGADATAVTVSASSAAGTSRCSAAAMTTPAASSILRVFGPRDFMVSLQTSTI